MNHDGLLRNSNKRNSSSEKIFWKNNNSRNNEKKNNYSTTLVTFDLKGLYTSIPNNFGLEAISF